MYSCQWVKATYICPNNLLSLGMGKHVQKQPVVLEEAEMKISNFVFQDNVKKFQCILQVIYTILSVRVLL